MWKKHKSQMGAVKLHSDLLLAHLSRKLESRGVFALTEITAALAADGVRSEGCFLFIFVFPLAVVGNFK